jgi:hypothetical protein
MKTANDHDDGDAFEYAIEFCSKMINRIDGSSTDHELLKRITRILRLYAVSKDPGKSMKKRKEASFDATYELDKIWGLMIRLLKDLKAGDD